MLDHEKVIRKLYTYAEGQGLDTEKFVSMFSDEGYMLDMASGTKFRGKAIGESIASLASAFPDVHRELLNIYVAENVVVVETAIRGTHKGELALASGTLAPTGKAIDVPVCDVYHLEGGKIISFDCYNLPSVMLQQLGQKNEVIMTTKPRIAIVIGSTRPGRYADKAADWMLKQTRARNDIEAELVDLRDHPMPFFDEKGPPVLTPSENAEALRWQKTLARYDGFVFVVAEYNSSITGVLKNALDQAYKERGRKPFTAIGYGGAGAARAIEHLRQITNALRMVSTAPTVNIGGADFMLTSPTGANKPIEDIEAHLLASTKSALDELVWWAHATMAAKAAEASQRRDPNELAA